MGKATAPIAWSWRNVSFGAAIAVPSTVATFIDPELGLPLAVGVIPAAALGVSGPRRSRVRTVLVGAVAGTSMFLGAAASPLPVVALLTLFALCVVVASLAGDPSRRIVPLLLALGLPLYGVGLSEGSAGMGLQAGLLILAGSVFAWLISLLWPSTAASTPPARPAVDRGTMVLYGVQIGLASSIAAGIGFGLGVDHPGWGAAAALLVSRPQRRQLDSRAVGRVASVTLGAVVACTLALFSPSSLVLALLVFAVLAAGAGVAGSRWYVFPFFSTLIVLSLLLLEQPSTAHWFAERVGLTLAGVALALLFAWLVPALAALVKGRTAGRDGRM